MVKLLISLVLILVSSISYAIEQTITLDQVIVEVLEKHPQLKIADYEAQAIAARIKIAAQRPADNIRIEMEDFGGTGDARWLGNVETTVSLARVLELGNKSAYRADVALHESYVLEDKQDADRLDLLSETARRFFFFFFDEQQVMIAIDAIKLTQQTVKIVENRISAGVAPIAERLRIDIDLARQELELEHAEHELASSRVRLSSLWNNIRPAFQKVNADIYTLEQPLTLEAYANLLDRNPDITRINTQHRLAESRIRLAQIKSKADIEITGGMRYIGESNDIGFILSADMPLGTAKRAAPSIEEAQLLGQIDPLALEQKQTELFVTLYALYQELLHSKTATTLFQERIIPAAKNAVTEYEKLYGAGRLSLLELVEAQRNLLNSRKQLLESVYKFHRLRIEIDRLTGAPVATGVLP